MFNSNHSSVFVVEYDDVHFSKSRPFQLHLVVIGPVGHGNWWFQLQHGVSCWFSIIAVCLNRTVVALWDRQTGGQTDRQTDGSQHCLMLPISSVAEGGIIKHTREA